MRNRMLLLIGLALGLAAGTARAGQDYNLELRLDGAISRGQGHQADLLVELQVRDGQVQDWLRGESPGINRGRHIGTVRAVPDGEGLVLTATVQVRRDYWAGGGRGRYTIRLRPGPDAGTWVGQFEGTFTVTEAPRPVAPSRAKRAKPKPLPDNAPDWLKKQRAAGKPSVNRWPEGEVREGKTVKVSGQVTGQRIAAWPVVLEERPAPKPGSHPRLLFTAEQVRQLRTFAKQDPVGRAMMQQFWKVIDRTDQVRNPKFSLWPAVGYGFAWQMTGEKKWADKARDHVKRYNHPPGGQDIHHGPALMGLALAYDLCYDGWDEEFRAEIAGELQQRVLENYTGTFGGRTMGGLNLAAWSNHNGIRASAAGLGALAVWNDKNADGESLQLAEAIARQCAWEVRSYLRDGLGGGHWGMEGVFYRGMTMRRGLLAFLTAYPQVTGEAIQNTDSGRWLISGYFLEAPPGQLFEMIYDHKGPQHGLGIDADRLPDLVWAMGGPLVEQTHLPAYKHLLEQRVGLAGDRTYGIVRGFYAPFALSGYPRKVEAAEPDEVLPWISPDPRNGHWVFRPTWKDRGDILMMLNLQSRVLPSCHYERTGTMSGWQLLGFGKVWLDGQYHPKVVEAAGARAVKNGPVTTAFRRDGRVAHLVINATPAYMPPIQRKRRDKTPAGQLAKAQGGIGAASLVHWPKGLIDFGVRARRHLTVDVSGRAGAPLLVALVEQVDRKTDSQAQARPTAIDWSLPLDGRGGKLTIQDRRFDLVNGSARMVGVVLGGGKLDGKVSTRAEDGRIFAVWILTDGPAPAITVDGEGLDAKIRLGRRSVRFDGEKIVLD